MFPATQVIHYGQSIFDKLTLAGYLNEKGEITEKFDMVILEHACRQIQQAVPWDYYNVRDTRTLYDLTDAELPNFSGHHALYDAMKQAIGVQNCYRKLCYNGCNNISQT